MSPRLQTLEELKGLVKLSGIPHDKTWELANQYWPDAYAERVINSPWLLVRTPYGMIRMGWRKRVLSISWEDTDIRQVITQDDVTKDETLVHAWSLPKALEYLTALAVIFDARKKRAVDEVQDTLLSMRTGGLKP